jgi:hypothetical protein
MIYNRMVLFCALIALSFCCLGSEEVGRHKRSLKQEWSSISKESKPVIISGDFECSSNGCEIEITKYLGEGGDVSIPEIVEGKPVTSIKVFAFNNSKLIRVFIPSNIRRIDELSFLDCSGLKCIDVDSGNPLFSSQDGSLFNKEKTKLIRGPEAFHGSYVIPGSVTEVGKQAFCGCNALTEIVIPEHLSDFNTPSLKGMASLSSITADPKNAYYSSKDGVLFNKEATTLIRCPYNMVGTYEIPSGVTNIASDAFRGCDNLWCITTSSNLSVIGSYAFSGCTNLVEVTSPANLTEIGRGAFYNCSNIKKVTFPASVKTIADRAFYLCSSLESADFLGDAPVVGSDVFMKVMDKFSISYQTGSTGFPSPAWGFYPCTRSKKAIPEEQKRFLIWGSLDSNKLRRAIEAAMKKSASGLTISMEVAMASAAEAESGGSVRVGELIQSRGKYVGKVVQLKFDLLSDLSFSSAFTTFCVSDKHGERRLRLTLPDHPSAREWAMDKYKKQSPSSVYVFVQSDSLLILGQRRRMKSDGIRQYIW